MKFKDHPRITAKEAGLIKGGLRRVFSRSDLRRQALKAVEVKHYDPNRIRVKKWAVCPKCASYTPLYKMEIDHVSPVIPVERSLKDMDPNELVDRIWCVVENLQALCPGCHKEKSRLESKQRRKKK